MGLGEPALARQQVDPAAAEEFLGLYHAECPDAGPTRLRVEQVRSQIDRYGTYTHSAAELAYGARAAWRNSSRCIGRLYWRSLRVRDRRDITAAEQVAAEAFAHLREATELGWSGGPGSSFDVLPLVVQAPGSLRGCSMSQGTRCSRCRSAIPATSGSPTLGCAGTPCPPSPTCAWRSAASVTRRPRSTGGTWAPRSAPAIWPTPTGTTCCR
jgi:Nitric oxide synthase, oxygenase domain